MQLLMHNFQTDFFLCSGTKTMKKRAWGKNKDTTQTGRQRNNKQRNKEDGKQRKRFNNENNNKTQEEITVGETKSKNNQERFYFNSENK